MITLIHGPTELLRAEALAAIRNGIADDPEIAELNTTRFDGRTRSVSELRNACDTLPFLAERRLVIAEGLLARLAAPAKGRGKATEAATAEDGVEETPLSPEAAKGQAKVLLAYLDEVPESTEMVLLEEDTTSAASHLAPAPGTDTIGPGQDRDLREAPAERTAGLDSPAGGGARKSSWTPERLSTWPSLLAMSCGSLTRS